MVKFKNFLLIFGGCEDESKFNELFKINLKDNTIQKIQGYGEIPAAKFGHSANVVGTSMYVFGGWNGFETQDDLYQFSLSKTWCDSVSNFWYYEKTCTGAKPSPRYRHASTRIGNSIFIFGGINQHQQKFNDLHEYNVATKDWCLIETYGSVPSPRTFHQLAAIDNKIYLIGGSSTEKLNDVYVISIYNLMDLDGTLDFTNHSRKRISNDSANQGTLAQLGNAERANRRRRVQREASDQAAQDTSGGNQHEA